MINHSTPIFRLMLVLALIGSVFSFTPATAAEPRGETPVTLTGSQLPQLKGTEPKAIVAFRFKAGKWEQIPVQVDQRDEVSYKKIYNLENSKLGIDFKNLVYTDAGTFTGEDSDPKLDDNDEVTFMAAEAGEKATGFPAGVANDSGVAVTLVDPLANNATSYVYLFKATGTMDPGAGRTFGKYEFKLKAGDYKTKYNTMGRTDSIGANPEDSTVETAFYKRHFSDRWLKDELIVKSPLGSGVNFLDRENYLFGPAVNVRSVMTFSSGEGAFIINKSGPVRGLRNWVGANSGPLTERLDRYYTRREDTHVYLRVHPIPGMMSFMNYNEAAKGMKYYNESNPEGLTIDGVPDDFKNGLSPWEMVKGSHGALIIIRALKTDLPKTSAVGYWLDDAAAKPVGGMKAAYGRSGAWQNEQLPNSDPPKVKFCKLEGICILFYEDKNATIDLARQRLKEIQTPLQVTTDVWK